MSGNKDPQPIADVLRREVDKAGAAGLVGSLAATKVRQAEPEFAPVDYGVQSFRAFVERYVPELRIIKRSGLDVVYGRVESQHLPEHNNSEPNEEAEAGDFWRVWVSPGSPMVLAVRRDGSSIRAVPASEVLADDEVALAPAPEAVHRHIAEEFLQNTEDPLRHTLRDILEDPSPMWWRDWLSLLKRQPTEILRRWQGHRASSIRGELRTRLKADGLTDAAILKILNIVRRSHRPRLERASVTEIVSKTSSHSTDMVALVHDVIGRMHEHELRTLSLPLGLVLDALSRKRSES